MVLATLMLEMLETIGFSNIYLRNVVESMVSATSLSGVLLKPMVLATILLEMLLKPMVLATVCLEML